MITFEDYAEAFQINPDHTLLDLCLKDQEYHIFEGATPFLTPEGNPFSHPSEAVIRHLITDLLILKSIPARRLSSPALYSFRKDQLDGHEDSWTANWENVMSRDLFVRNKIDGTPGLQPFSPHDPLFNFSFIAQSGLIEVVNGFAGRVMSQSNLEESVVHPFPELLKLSYLRLSGDQRAAVQALSGVHRSGIVLPVLLVLGEISAVEYVKGLIALRIQPQENYQDLLAEAADIQSYLSLLTQKSVEERPLAVLIGEGEGGSVEYKSTLRWDIRAGKTNPAIERSCLKTISAFLNTSGGSLLIGIRDDGSVEGIETDKFANDDKFLLHLWTLIRICLGRDVSPYIRSSIEKSEDKTVCVVECQPSTRPVFLRQPGFPEEMFIRVGPSSNAVDISEALKYIQDHFPGKIS